MLFAHQTDKNLKFSSFNYNLLSFSESKMIHIYSKIVILQFLVHLPIKNVF